MNKTTNNLKTFNLNNFMIIIALAIAYFVAGKLSLSLANEQHIVTVVIFASEGIALASALYFGKRVVIGIFLGQLVLALSSGLDTFSSIEISTINSLEALLGIYLFDKYRLKRDLSRMKDIVGLAFLIIFILQPFSAIAGNAVLLLNSIITYDEIYRSLFLWWFGNLMGQLLFTPFILQLFISYKKIKLLEYIIYTFLFASFIYLLEIIIQIENLALLLTFTIPLTLYVLLKKGINYALLFVIVVAIVSSYSAFIEVGFFSIHSNIINIINIDFFILAHLSITLVSGVILQEKKQIEIDLELKISEELSKNREQQLLIHQQSRLIQMGEMISMIAHQWRQPLSAISATAGAIQFKVHRDKLDKETAIKLASKINEISLHLSETIDDFRNFFQPDKELKESSYNQLISSCLSIIQTSIENQNIKIVQDLKSTNSFQTYPNELKQVILNLIKNAEDILIEKNIENPSIKITTYTQDNLEILEVSDNAGGVPSDIIDKIFDPYFSTKLNKNGTGLGLYMSKTIIQEHCKGELSVKNNADGAVFKIILTTNETMALS